MKVMSMATVADRPVEDAQGPVPGRVRQVALPAGVRALSTLPRIDYDDAFLAGTGPHQGRTAEQWARAVLEGAPRRTQTALSRGWFALGLRVGPVRSEQRVLGWQVRLSTPDAALLGADGRLGLSGELLFLREPAALLFATFVQLDNPAARALWAGISARHRQIVSQLLDQAISPSAPEA
jgi:hypothetical protein